MAKETSKKGPKKEVVVNGNGYIYTIAPQFSQDEKSKTPPGEVESTLEVRNSKKANYLEIGIHGGRSYLENIVVKIMNVPKENINYQDRPFWMQPEE